MTIYPPEMILQLERLAATAADKRRCALKSVHAALMADQRSTAVDVRREIKRRSEDQIRWAERFLCEQLVLTSKNRPNLDKDFTSLLIRWLGSVQSVVCRKPTPHTEKESQPTASGDVAEIPAVNIRQAIAHERAARSAVNELFNASYAGRWPDGLPCNPMSDATRMVLLKNKANQNWLENSDNDVIDELMADGFEALTNRIDQFDPAQGSFLALWYTLLSNCLRDRMRKSTKSREKTNEDANASEGRYDVRPVWEEDLFSQPFSDADWTTIQGWKELAVDIPVVLIVGFDWVTKVQSKDEHKSEFCQWLIEYGVSDPDTCISKLATAPQTTSARFTILAECGNKKNSGDIGAKFSRPFAGIHQTAKQTSFGKNHHAIELDFFWQLEWVIGGHASLETLTRLNQMPVGPRVTALCCVPAWHFLTLPDSMCDCETLEARRRPAGCGASLGGRSDH